jgi:hypothetical protein
VKKLALIAIFALALITGLRANNDPVNLTLLSGKIIDKQTGETLTGVKIMLKGTDKYCYTDMNGCFTFAVSAASTAEVVLDMVGYEPATLKTAELSLGNEIALTPRQ